MILFEMPTSCQACSLIYICKYTGLAMLPKAINSTTDRRGKLVTASTPQFTNPWALRIIVFLVCAWCRNVIEYLLSDEVRGMWVGILLLACGMLHSVASETGTLQHEVAAQLSPFLGAGHTSPLAFPISLWCTDKVPFVWVVALGERAHSFETLFERCDFHFYLSFALSPILNSPMPLSLPPLLVPSVPALLSNSMKRVPTEA